MASDLILMTHFFSKILSPKFETFFHSNIFLRVKKLIINVPIECATAPPSYASFKKKIRPLSCLDQKLFLMTQKIPSLLRILTTVLYSPAAPAPPTPLC